MLPPPSTDAERLAAFRAALPALGAGIYLNTGSVGPIALETAAAMAEVAERELRVGRAHPAAVEELLQRREEARAAAASVVTADPADVALVRSTTDGVNAFLVALDLRAGDHIVTTTVEHAAVTAPVATAVARGATVTRVDLGDGTGPDVDAATIAAVDAAVTDATRLVAVSHVAWTTGAVLPVAEIAELAHRRGARVLVDGAQAVGAIPVDVPAIGADAYVFGAQKWLLGPEGIGALVLDPARTAGLAPGTAGYFSMTAPGTVDGGAFLDDARRFETSGFHGPTVVGMARAISWLAMFVGWAWIHERATVTARHAAERLAAIPGVTVLTPWDRMATLVTFRIGGWPAQAAMEELGARVFAITRTIDRHDALRISVGAYTSDEELDRFLDAVALLAAHTPETIPARRTLTILGAD